MSSREVKEEISIAIDIVDIEESIDSIDYFLRKQLRGRKWYELFNGGSTSGR